MNKTAVRFTQDDWDRIAETYKNWWARTAKKPSLALYVQGEYKSAGAILSQTNCTDFSKSPEEIVDAIDDMLSARQYFGCAFPHFNMDVFGPGVIAAMCGGAVLDNSSGRVWFHPKENLPLREIHAEYDPKNKWTARIKAIYHAANKKWRGAAVMGFPDLGGPLDAAAALRGSDNLLMDLYDEPEEVRRLCVEIQTAWFAAYDDLAEVLAESGRGITDWSGIYSEKRAYISQCDFSYMIGAEQFRAFALPDLRDFWNRMENNVYHLDGVGELRHLNMILEDESLGAVQWVPGDGQPSARRWPEVYQKIAAAGKGSFLCCGDYGDFTALSEVVDPNLIYQPLWLRSAEEAKEILERAG
jgi:5-methyltetrahydrofolate--homocysteine methyltransferase